VELKATCGLTQRAGAVLNLAHIAGSIGLSEEGCWELLLFSRGSK